MTMDWMRLQTGVSMGALGILVPSMGGSPSTYLAGDDMNGSVITPLCVPVGMLHCSLHPIVHRLLVPSVVVVA